MKSKQEVIELAWGEYYSLLKDKLSEDGSILGWEMLILGIDPHKINISVVDGRIIPDKILSLDKNNDWIPISTRPPSTGDYFVEYEDNQIKILKYDTRLDDFSNGHRSGYIKRVKYWQPITLPQNSLYNG